MGKNIKALWRIRRKELVLYLSWTGGIWILGNLVFGLLKQGGKLPEALPIATMMAAFSGLIMGVIGFGTEVFFGYDFFVRFCHTRKEFLLASAAVTFFESLLLTAVLKICLELEIGLSSLFVGSRAAGPAEEMWERLLQYVSVPWLPVYALLLTGLSCAGASFLHRFRTRGGVILIFLWILAFMGLPRLLDMPWFSRAAGAFLGMPEPLQIFLGLLAGAVLYLAGSLGFKRAGTN